MCSRHAHAMLTPPEKYEKFNAGARPMRMREYTTMNNNENYSKNKQIDLLPDVFLSKTSVPFLKILDRNGKCTAAIFSAIVG